MPTPQKVCGVAALDGLLYIARCGAFSVEITDQQGIPQMDYAVPCCVAGPITADPSTHTISVLSVDIGTEYWTTIHPAAAERRQ